MESLQALLARVAGQLRDLNRSQRIAIVLGGLLVAVSLVWLLQWAATPEMVPLLDQELEPEELARVQQGLELSGQPFKLVGRKVMVRADANRQVLLAQLQQNDSLPADTSVGFSALVKESNPWISQAEHERRWSVALKNEIERVLRQFAGVKSAHVFLPMTTGRPRFARREAPAKASVTLVMQGGQPVTRELALAAARLVSGAVRGLPLRNVEVLDGNGVSALDWESETSGITALDRLRRKHEQDIRAKILSQLPDPKALVQVQVELELTNKASETETPSRPVEVAVDTTSEETTRAQPGGEPGVKPNVAVVPSAATPTERTVKETSKTELRPGIKRTTESTPPGGIKQIWAAVSISRSYLEGIYRQANPEADPPTRDQIAQIFEQEKAQLIRQLTKLVKPQDPQQVDVAWYTDVPFEVEPAAGASTLDETLSLVRRYGPQSGLALLAFLSLGLMLRMGRKTDAGESFGLEIGLPKEAIEAAQQAAKDVASAVRQGGVRPGPAEAEAGEGVILDTGATPIGQAAITEGVLVAQEVDEKTVQTNKMLQQVSQVVESDAENAAALLEQWIRRSDSFEA